MTRRIVKPQPDPESDGIEYIPVAPSLDWEQHYNEIWKPFHWETSEGESISSFCPYGQPGDVLWVRETWTEYGSSFFYKADGPAFNEGPFGCANKWKPSIHMPKEACRIFLEVVSVRVERLQDISEQDAIAEGIQELLMSRMQSARAGSMRYRNYSVKPKLFNEPVDAYKSFKTLWQSINGPASWDANPWVWVVEFKRIDKPENFN